MGRPTLAVHSHVGALNERLRGPFHVGEVERRRETQRGREEERRSEGGDVAGCDSGGALPRKHAPVVGVGLVFRQAVGGDVLGLRA